MAGSEKRLLMILDNETGEVIDWSVPEGLTYEEARMHFGALVGGLQEDGFGIEVQKVEQHRHDDPDAVVRTHSHAR